MPAADGVAVTGDALVTTSLFAVVVRRVWDWPMWTTALLIVPMTLIDLLFWSSNVVKVLESGWVPALIALVACFTMYTYNWGREQERRTAARFAAKQLDRLNQAPTTAEEVRALLSTATSVPALLMALRAQPPPTRTPALAVFLTPYEWRVPPSLGTLAATLGCLPATIVLLTVRFEPSVPFVASEERCTFDPLDASVGAYRLVLHVGYAEALTAAQLLPVALARAAAEHVADFPDLEPLLGLAPSLQHLLPRSLSASATAAIAEADEELDDSRLLESGSGDPLLQPSVTNVTFILSRLTYSNIGGHSWFTRLRIRLYQLMVSNARKPMRFFGLPADRTIEISSVRFL
jgi:KUP system potassium uptake protein